MQEKLLKLIDKKTLEQEKNETDLENFKNAKFKTPNACVAYVTMKSMEGQE